MSDLPTGTVTFLFTDIEGSTKLARTLGSRWTDVLAEHNAILRDAIRAAEGIDLRTEGDAFFAVFRSPSDAVRSAATAQRALLEHSWPPDGTVRVRMGVHTGQGVLGGDDYIGLDVHRAARIAAAAHGGQVLISEATHSVLGDFADNRVALRDLGKHRLKDFDEPQLLLQLLIDGLQSEFPALRTLERPSNLPVQVTSFVGRERELDVVTELVQRSRVLTLTGPGGIGKTRLAVQAAGRLMDAFVDGTFFVDLSPISDPTILPETIASTLRLRTESSLPALEIVADHLRDRSALLILDNFEQVLEGAGTLAAIVRSAPRVRALATSRSPLGIAGEQEFPLAPFELPDANQNAATLAHNDAVALFAERAREVDPGFPLDDETAPIVAAICARLDALPLAIELAASRVRLLPPRRLLEQLGSRLGLLVGGPRDAPERQRTLRGAIAWSYDLLDEDLQAIFRRLSVFAAEWTLEAAREVACPDREIAAILEPLELLTQHSLVRPVSADEEGRVGMLETIREFGLERLEESGEADAVRMRHAAHFLRLAEEGEPYLTGPEQRRWLDLLERNHDDLRSALRWAIDGDRGEVALRLGAALWRFWYSRGHLNEGRRWLDDVVALPSAADQSANRARALTALGGITYWQNDFETSHGAYTEALAIFGQLGDRRGVVEGLFNLAETAAVRGDLQTAESLMQESLQRATELGDRRGVAWALWGLGTLSFFSGDPGGARTHLDQSRRIFEEIKTDSWGLGNVLGILGGIAAQEGRPLETKALILKGIDAYGDQSNALLLAIQLGFLAMAANEAGYPDRAVRLASAGQAVRQKLAGQLPDVFFPFADPLARAAALLDPETFERTQTEGESMTLADALAYAREEW